jgi:phage FluMu gp28-like protein
MSTPENQETRSSYFLPYQIRWLQDDSPVKIWEKSRRIGATYVQSYEDVYDCVTGRVDKVWFSSADESAAKEYIAECSKWAQLFNMAATALGEIMLDERNDIKALAIEFANGSRIHALSSNPKAFRSKGGKVILDEFAFHEQAQQLWKAAKPSATWGYPIRILSTHNGKQCLYHQFLEKVEKGQLNWSRHNTPITLAVEEGLLDKIRGRKTSPEERAAWIDELRADSFDEETFLEEFMCVPVEGTSRFLPYDMITACEKPDLLQEPGDMQGDLYVGFDIARKKDLSVITVVQRTGGFHFMRACIVMERQPFYVQRDTLFSILQLPGIRRACIDSTGLGMQLAEEAVFAFGKYRVEPVTFSEASKSEMAFQLRSRFEEKTIAIPPDPLLRDDLASIKKAVTSAGNVRFAVAGQTDGHADRFWSLALANHAAENYSGPVFARSSSLKPTSSLGDPL